MENTSINMDLKTLMSQEGKTLIDVREPYEFAEGHVEGSINIPLAQVQHKIDEFAAMSKPLIMMCRSGARSGMATAILSARGVSEVYNGGGWEEVEAAR